MSVLCSASPESPHQDGQTIQKRCLTADWLTCHAGLDQTSNKKQSRRHLKEVLSWKSNPSDCFASLAMTRMGSLRGLPFLLIARLSLSRHCEGFPFSSLGGSLFRHCEAFPPLVIARHEVPKQSQVPIGHTMKALGRKEPASQSNPSDCFASLAMTRMKSLRGLPFSSLGGLPFSSLRGFLSLAIARDFPFSHWGVPFFVIARHFPLRHCEARSAEAISGSDRPYDERVGPKGTSVSVQPLRLLRFARNDENGVIARHFPLPSLRGTKCRSNLGFR